MKTNKGRLMLYLILSFGLTWLWFLLMLPKGETWDEMPVNMQSFVALGMLFPFIAHVLTRWLTKEGFAMTGEGSMLLGISFRDKKWIYFLAAMLLPWFYTELGNAFTLLLNPECFDSKYYLSLDLDKRLLPLLPANAIITGTIVSFAAFGEEAGWRGYMMPKLLSLMPRWAALLVGGVIWGLWHAPLTCIGHNFGTEYPGYPWLGILLMCFICILLGVILTWITEMSGSVWPAAIIHGVNNAGASILGGYLNPEKERMIWGVSCGWLGMLIGQAIVVFVVIFIWRKRKSELQIKTQPF